MHTIPSPHSISNFVNLALVGTLTSMLSSHANFEKLNERHSGVSVDVHPAGQPSTTLLLVCSAVFSVCTEATICDADDLEHVIDTLRRQFEVSEDCAGSLRTRALELMEHCLAQAAGHARAALEEALAGFPVSGGSFKCWRAFRLGMRAVS